MKSLFSFLLIGSLLFGSVPITQTASSEATPDEAVVEEVQQAAAVLEEVFVTESGALADGADGSYVGIPSEAFEPCQAFEQVTVGEDNTMTDADGNEIGTYSEEMEGAVTEEELARPRIASRMLAATGSAGQSIEINDFRAVIREGAVRNSDGDYVWTAPNSNSDHRFTYRIYYAFSGVGEYEPDQIHITIPKSILRDRSGELADIYELPLPEYTEEGLTEQNLFVYKEDGENLVIFNRLSCSAAQSGYIEVSYTTTKSTFDYADYLSENTYHEKGGSDPFSAQITLLNDLDQISDETQKIPVYIDTTAKLTSVIKRAPYSAYSSWNNAWGDEVKPADAEDYEYLVWSVEINASATQPYDLVFRDTFNEPDAMLLGYRDGGIYKSTLTKTNVRSRYTTIYVLTAHKKSTYNALLEEKSRYTLNNSVAVTLTPMDKVDSPTVNTAGARYVKEVPRFETPSGHLYANKYGFDASNSTVWSSNQIRDYSLVEFSEDENATIGSLRYYADVYGYAYPWTIAGNPSYEELAADPERYYGQHPVTYELSDNSFYLKEISDEEYSEKLTAEDYELEYIELSYTFTKATYNDERKSFDTQSMYTYSDDDIITVYAEKDGSGEYVKAADYSLRTRSYTYTDAADELIDKLRTAGDRIYFAGNITGFRLTTTNAYWYTKLGAYPYAKLKHSETVDSYVAEAVSESGVTKLCLMNAADSLVRAYHGGGIISFTRSAVDYITGKVKDSRIGKSFVGGINNKKKKEYTATWVTDASEHYYDNDGSHNITQQSGIFYDLLPDGAVYKKDSLSVYADGKKLDAWKYTVSVDENYRDSGRTMLKIAIKESAGSYRFVYSTVHSWESIADFGTELLNTVAFETGNSSITNGKTAADTRSLTEAELMKNLDPEAGDSKRFLYTQSSHTANFLVEANLGLHKNVRSENDTAYTASATVYNDGNYYYNVRFATNDESKAKNLIAFDSLENYTVTFGQDVGKSSEWRGTLLGVDTHQLEELGIAPKVYYSTVEGLNIDRHHDLTDTSVWTFSGSFAGALSEVRAIAVDMRTAADGSEYVLPQETGVQFIVRMHAPHGVDDEAVLPKAYNNIYLNNNIINASTGSESGERLVHQEYTAVTLKVKADLELLKVSRDNPEEVAPGIGFTLSGTSDYGTKVDETLYTDENGRITRADLEKGTYTLRETETTDDFFFNDTVFTVVVDGQGTLTVNGSSDVAPYVIADPPRVHGDLEFLKKGGIDNTSDTIKLTGAQFKLEGTSYYGNDILLYGTSGGDGVVHIENIERGTYTLTETKAADGYIATREEYSVVCDQYGIVTLYHIVNGSPVEVKPTENGYSVIVNEPLHNFRLVKYDPLNNALLSGAEFTLKGRSDYGTPVNMTAVSESVLSDEGIVLFKGLEPGYYTLQETKAPPHYQINDASYSVRVQSNDSVSINGLTKMPSDWHSGFYAGCFGVPNTREYEGEITITKRWLDADGNPITDPSELPFPVVHVDTSEPVIDLPPQDAYIRPWPLANILRNASTFQKTTVNYTRDNLPENAVRVDDQRSRSVIYVWVEGSNGYWWSDAAAAHLPDNSASLFSNTSLGKVDLRGFDTSNVTGMDQMFFRCKNLYEVNFGSAENGDLIDTSNVKYMQYMFYECSNLWSLDMSGLDTSSVIYMNGMFYGCSFLQSLKNDGWDTSNVTDMSSMFAQCRYLNGDDYSNLDTSSVKDMSRMFENSRLTDSADFSSWDTSNVTNMAYMFSVCSMSENAIQSLKNWDTGNVTSMYRMFGYCSSLISPDFSNWDTGNVTNMGEMFSGCYNLNSLDVSGWDTGNVTNMGEMFSGCYNLNSLDVSGWDTGNVTNMSKMFYYCTALVTLDLSSWDIENVTDMYCMFKSCEKLTTIDVSGFDTSKVTDIGQMFRDCYSLTTLDLSGWDTSSVTFMSTTFSGCRSLTTLDLSGWDTSKVTNMSGMFSDCRSLITLDLSSFDTSKVTDMASMFSESRVLQTIYAGDGWVTENIRRGTTYGGSLFYYCTDLVGGAGTTYNSSHTDVEYARVDNPPDEPGYFTYKAYVRPSSNGGTAATGASKPTDSSERKLPVLKESTSARQKADSLLAGKAAELMEETATALPAESPQEEPALLRKAEASLAAVGAEQNAKVSFSQTTNSELWDGTGSSDGKWVDNGDGTWTYKMKVFDVAADYYVWEYSVPGFKCDLDDDNGIAVLHYPTEKNVTITNTRTTDDTCSLTLKKELTGGIHDWESVLGYNFENMDFHFTVKLTGEGLAGKKVFGHTAFTDGEATVTMKAGEQMVFTNIPKGVSYTVTEREENYRGVVETTYSTSSTGILDDEHKNVTVTVTNHVIERPLRALEITKIVLPYDGGTLDEEDLSRVFTFDIDLNATYMYGKISGILFAGGKATVYLKHGETLSLTGLPTYVDTCTVTEIPNALYTCDQPVQEQNLTPGETAHITFTNTKIPEEERETGGFTLKKTVDGKSTDAKFAFNVSMQNLDKNMTYTLSDGSTFTSDLNGGAELTVQLAHGESVKFSDLPEGATYTVSEQACGYYAAYTISGTERVVPLSRTNTVTDRQLATSRITVQKDDDIVISYTNTDKRFDVQIAKVDEDDEYVTDAVLQIVEKDNEENVLAEWITTDDVYIAQIPQGTYLLREKQAPFGYMKAADIEFTVDANGIITSDGETVIRITMVDKPVTLAVTGAGGVMPIVLTSATSFTMLLFAVVIKKRKSFKKISKGE